MKQQKKNLCTTFRGIHSAKIRLDDVLYYGRHQLSHLYKKDVVI